MSTRSTGKAAVVLTTGRTIGFVVAFAIPIVLARCLTQASFGIYKYLFLLYSTLAFMQIGMAESLYYFVPRSRPQAGSAVLNAVITLAGAGLLAVAVLSGGASLIARMSGNASIAPYLPTLGLFLGLMLIATPLEIVMVSRNQCTGAAFTYAASDTLRAAALVLPGILTHDIRMLLLGLVVFAGLRCLGMGWYLMREFGPALRPDRAVWRSQFGYALPFAAAVLVETLQINLHQYVVWAKFDAAAFAIYSVGCLQIPLVDLLATSTANVMMVRMGEEQAELRRSLRMWDDAVTRLAFVFFPLVLALLLTGRDLIVALFTVRYASSTPIFLISTIMIAFAAFPVDAVLRAYAETRFLVFMNVVRLVIIAAGVLACLRIFGLPGAILITVLATGCSKSLAIWRIGRLFQVGVTEILPWRSLATTLTLSAAAALPVVWFHAAMTMLPALARGAATASLYGLIYLGASAGLRALLGSRDVGDIAPEIDRSKSLI